MADFDPMRELNNLARSVGRMVEQGVQSVQNVVSGTSGIALKLDIYEVDGSVVVRSAPIDGIVADSIEVNMEAGILSISGEARPEETPHDASFLLQERRFGAFSREVAIHLPVIASEARAKLKDGALIITIPIDPNQHNDSDIYADTE